MLKRIIVLVLIALFCACKGHKNSEILPVNDFFKAVDKYYYQISPDGKSLLFLKLQDGANNLFVEELATGKTVQLTHLKEKRINLSFWTSNNEIVYYAVDDSKQPKSDLFVINRDGTNRIQITSNERSKIKILSDKLVDNKYIVFVSNKRDSAVFDAYRLNIRDGKMKMIAKNPGNFKDWMTDNNGILRIAVSSDGVNETLLYREDEQKPFKPVFTNNFKITFAAVAFDEKEKDLLYAISDIDRDKCALVTLDLKTGKEKEVIFASDSLNVVDAKYSTAEKKILYVTCENWRKETFYLDSATKTKYAKIDRLLPKTVWQIVNKDKADNIFVIRSFTDKNPGAYFLYNASENKIRKLATLNSAIKEEEMSEMKPISYKASDGLVINGYLTLPKNKDAKNLPVVVLPHTGPGRRNVWGYNADVQFLASRGYAVLQVNYRGSSGYGKTFYAAGLKQWSNKIQEDVNDGVKWLIAEKIANPKRIAIYGYGFGGYIALTCMYKNPNLYACGGANSGVINLFSYFKAIPPYAHTSLQMYHEIIGNPITETDFLRNASPIFQVDRFKKPIFITENPQNQLVNSAETVQFIKELKKRNIAVTYIENKNGTSPITAQTNRLILYKALEGFLKENLGKN